MGSTLDGSFLALAAAEAHWGWDGDGCQFRKLLWLPLMSTPETETPLALD